MRLNLNRRLELGDINGPFCSLCFLLISTVLAVLLFYSASPVTSQTPNQNMNANIGRPSQKAGQLPPRPTPTPESSLEVVKVDVDLVNRGFSEFCFRWFGFLTARVIEPLQRV